MSLTVATGQVAIRYTDDDGKEKTIEDHLKLPADLANGIAPILIGNIDFKATPQTTVSMLVSTPKPRLVKLQIGPSGEDSFSVAGSRPSKLSRYFVKVEIGGYQRRHRAHRRGKAATGHGSSG